MVAVAVEATKATSPLNRRTANKAVCRTVRSIIVSPLRLLNRLMVPNRMAAVVVAVVVVAAVVAVVAAVVAVTAAVAVAVAAANTQWSPR